ncbi:MAG: hypothetical protein WC862_00705 [Patescibacteria group bacterium]
MNPGANSGLLFRPDTKSGRENLSGAARPPAGGRAETDLSTSFLGDKS